jgi:hypothetical protein
MDSWDNATCFQYLLDTHLLKHKYQVLKDKAKACSQINIFCKEYREYKKCIKDIDERIKTYGKKCA